VTDAVLGRPKQDVADAHTEQPSLNGRKVLITGGTTGIGRAIAVLLASEGAKVFVCGRDRRHLGEALQRIREVGDGDGISLDLAKRESIDQLFEAADNFLGNLDVAVINAAVSAEDLENTSEDDLYYQTAVDFTAYLATTKAALERMSKGADIIIIGSMSAVSREAGSSVYVAAKAGIEGFAEALREEVAEKDIKVGLIEPGFTGADLQYPDFPPDKQREQIHQHKMLRAEDIAASVQFMLTQPRRTAISLMRVETRLQHQ
jgi:3-oxoacyl-[acyl-carrier protein] reductase